MRMGNEYLPTTPFDLYELHLLQLVARHGSFTVAAGAAGLTQSAMTRQVQGVEVRLGVPLFERTTRRVKTTPAGEFLLRETAGLAGNLDALLRRLREDFTDAPKEVRVGVAQTISVAFLPGFFAAQKLRQPRVQLRITHQASATLLARLEVNELDVAILCPPARLPPSLRISHRFTDAFDLILPPDAKAPTQDLRRKPATWREWLAAQSWLLIHEASNTGTRLRGWLKKRGWQTGAATELDSFDLIINLVALGQGVSLVPQRSLALYGRQKKVQRFTVPERFQREIVIVTRRNPPLTAHVEAFVENVLF
jgi:DNA-binding transcriptional LysR family regulator